MWQRAKNYYHLVTALLANIYYGFPSHKLTVIGITGTSGKSTTTHMIYEVLKQSGQSVSLLSTVKAVIGGKDYDTGFHVTTPDPHVLPKYLKQAVDNGDKYFVLEVSSHALDQNRAAFVQFEVGVLTTLAHEHLDYHKTYKNYARAKFKLLHQSKHVVLPEWGIKEELKSAVRFEKIVKNAKTFGLTKGDVTQKKWNLKLKMPGDFNLLDGLAAAAVGDILGIPIVKVKKALENFDGLLGRFEEITTKKDFRVVIDFAHKPDAVEGVIKAARDQIKGRGRVIIMYGSASQRDWLKRGMMGEISGKMADITVITDEDPRMEEPMQIINDIADGCIKGGAKELPLTDVKPRKEHVFYKEHDRQKAIEFIITKLARKGDIILLCGKGHEVSMNYEGIEKPWSEHKAVQKALQLLDKSA